MKMHLEWSLERGDLLPLLLVMPALLLITCILVVPLTVGLALSFYDFQFGTLNFSQDFVGFANYIKFFHDPTALRSVFNTLMFSGGALIGMFFFGTIVSLLLFYLSTSISRWIRPLVTIPLLISPIVVGLIWRYIYDPQGILYWALGLVNITIEEFPGVTGASTALLATIIAHCWQVVPFVVIVLTAGLVSIPKELYEAADIDGVNAYTAFWKITFPLLKDVYMVLVLVTGVDTVMIFDIIYSLTGGGPNNATVSTSIYAFNQAFTLTNFSYAMVLSIVTIFLSFSIFGIPFIRRNLARVED
ncbi:MAG: carbohydrate ABC transporter permease [Spirochaetota bacterium]